MACKLCNTAANRAHQKFSIELMSPEKHHQATSLVAGKRPPVVSYRCALERSYLSHPPSELWDILMGQSLVYISEGAREEHHYEGLFFPLGAFAGVLI